MKDIEADGHKIAKTIYQKEGNYELALLEMEAFQSLNDSIFNLSATGQINALQAQFESLKKEATIKDFTIQVQGQIFRNWSLIGGLVLFSLLALLLFNRFRLKKKQIPS